MRILSNAYFLAQIKGWPIAARYAFRCADADLIVLRVFGAVGIGCIAVDLVRIFN